ncbi:MFS transporter [Penicillium malachiteum]|uniref:MFS transporter n=1 Tax=Penicillium malachiteum TaxID=1324776 RepID=A0AAD6HWM7_9EURO|nr:MFS transporter [Penicillium malachiteum]
MSNKEGYYSEATPLLREQSSYQSTQYHSTTRHTYDAENSSSSEELIEEVDFPVLAHVQSTSQVVDIEPTLERTASVSSAKRGAGNREDDDTSYAARFIGVSPTRFWMIFVGSMIGYVIGFFDSTLMASSHPVITSYFNAANAASWLSTAFLLTSTAFMPLFGRTSDTFGRKPVYLFSIAMFFITTAWCGLARSMGSFIAARAFCGLGAGGVFSMGQILSSDLVHIEYRSVYQSYLNLCLGTGSCLGLAFGGFLCDKIGWRNAFLIQLPFIFIYFITALCTIPANLGMKQTDPERRTMLQVIRSIDLTGSFFLVLAVTALIMGLNLGGNVLAWTHPLVICSLVAAVVLSIILVRYERNVPRAVLPIELLSHEPRRSIIFGNFFGNMSVNTMMFNVPLYFQAVKLATPTESGLRLVGASIAVTISSLATGFLVTWSRRFKPTILLGGFFILLGGLLAGSMDIGTPDSFATIFVSFSSFGQGFAFPTLMVSILATSEQADQAVATTTLGLFRNLGSVLGVSISSWIFQNVLIYELGRQVTGESKEYIIGLVRKSIPSIADLDPLHQQQVIRSYAMALRVTFLSAAVWGGIMLILHCRLRLPRLGRKA